MTDDSRHMMMICVAEYVLDKHSAEGRDLTVYYTQTPAKLVKNRKPRPLVMPANRARNFHTQDHDRLPFYALYGSRGRSAPDLHGDRHRREFAHLLTTVDCRPHRADLPSTSRMIITAGPLPGCAPQRLRRWLSRKVKNVNCTGSRNWVAARE